ncbi:MAG: energy-coupling factor transporter transmembrane protein EcfT [Candidatus Eremiobacteraeota bacterium]|nr:energy-coupling factor transporter transmembrane protein EcfT [Candidatus Eremiobacteraeota bacterium]
MNLLKDITIGQYVPGNSIIHRMDPRVKIALVFILMIQLFITESWVSLGSYFALLLLVTLLSGISPGYILKGLRPIIFLVLITLIFNFFFSKGDAIWQQRIFSITISITQQGVQSGLRMAARLILLVYSTSLLTLTTSPIQLTDAIENILTPFKVIGIPAHELAMMMSIALRFIPVLIEETDKIFKAQKSRGARFGRGNIIQKAKSLLPILVPLFVHAFKHAEDLAVAMESRCYRGGERRTRLKQLRVTGLDCWATLLCGLVLVGAAWWDFYGKL